MARQALAWGVFRVCSARYAGPCWRNCVFRPRVTSDSDGVTGVERVATPAGGIMHEYMHDHEGASGGLAGA